MCKNNGHVKKIEESVFNLLDGIAELVYMVDPKTYDIFYVNRTGMRAFGIGHFEGCKCYEVFQGLTEPCEFCNTHLLTKGETFTWERFNPVTGRYYILKDCLTEWCDRDVRIELAIDISDQVREKQQLQNTLTAEIMLMKCVRVLYQESDLSTSINHMLKQLGTELSAERCYIFDVQRTVMNNTYEWCADGVESQIQVLQSMEVTLLERWREFFTRGECVLIEDMEDIREISPKEYRILSEQNIRSLVAAPLEEDGELIGFVGVDNPAVEKIHSISPLLNTLRYFLMTTMKRIQDEKKLTILSYYDTLTKLFNRNRYIRDIEKLKNVTETLGVVFMDLNGLKEINDQGGHAVGDAALVYCAGALVEAFPEADRYRIGGDEFVVLVRGMEEESFRGQVRKLHSRFRGEAPYRVAIGEQWSDSSDGAEQMILEADTRMYEDKRRYYRKHGQSSRYRSFGEDENFAKDNPMLREYNMLMSSMNVSVSKHLMTEEFPVIWANDSFYALTGYTKEEYDSRFHGSCKEYFSSESEEYARLVRTVMEAYYSGKTGYEKLLRMPKKDGKTALIHVNGTFTDERIDGVPTVYAVFSDVTHLLPGYSG